MNIQKVYRLRTEERAKLTFLMNASFDKMHSFKWKPLSAPASRHAQVAYFFTFYCEQLISVRSFQTKRIRTTRQFVSGISKRHTNYDAGVKNRRYFSGFVAKLELARPLPLTNERNLYWFILTVVLTFGTFIKKMCENISRRAVPSV